MGLISAAVGATLGTLRDQWKEYFLCDALDNDVLMVRGQKVVSSFSGNKTGSNNIITQGSGISVANGQCMIIVDQGVVTEIVAEPGLYTYDKSTEPSILVGDLNEAKIREVLRVMWERFKYGGDTGHDQRVYYFNIKEIVDNKFGTAVPIPFRVVDRNVGLDLDVSLRCNGVFSFKLTDPISFYENVCGNVTSQYDVSQIQSQLKAEFISALQPALAKLSDLAIRPYAIPSHVAELCQAMNQELSRKWTQLRGISVVSIAINSVTLPEEDAKMIQSMQRGAALRDPTMAAAQLAAAQAEAMKTAAGNQAGAITGFMGMGMASQMGGINAADLYRMAGAQPQQFQQPQYQQPQYQQPAQQPQYQQPAQQSAAPAQQTWTCSCGSVCTGKFCPECGKPRPSPNWRCACGTIATGKFCPECGAKRPD